MAEVVAIFRSKPWLVPARKCEQTHTPILHGKNGNEVSGQGLFSSGDVD